MTHQLTIPMQTTNKMKSLKLFLLTAWLMLLNVNFVSGQISYDPSSNDLVCKRGDNFCNGASLQTNILMTCNAPDVLKIYSCDLQLAHILPAGYTASALCYESSPSAGDAVCTFNGTAWQLDGSFFPLAASSLAALEGFGVPDGSGEQLEEPSVDSITAAAAAAAATDIKSKTETKTQTEMVYITAAVADSGSGSEDAGAFFLPLSTTPIYSGTVATAAAAATTLTLGPDSVLLSSTDTYNTLITTISVTSSSTVWVVLSSSSSSLSSIEYTTSTTEYARSKSTVSSTTSTMMTPPPMPTINTPTFRIPIPSPIDTMITITITTTLTFPPPSSTRNNIFPTNNNHYNGATSLNGRNGEEVFMLVTIGIAIIVQFLF